MKILCVSDMIDERIYTVEARSHLADVDLVLGAGDLPGAYLEFLADLLDVPVYYVFGNHVEEIIHEEGKSPRLPLGCINLDDRVVRHRGGKRGRTLAPSPILLAGLGGSRRYRPGPHQYGEVEMALRIVRLIPALLYNLLRYGRTLDVLLTHAPPRGIHDGTDLPHRGFQTFHPLMKHCRPRFLVHGHHSEYDRRVPTRTRQGETWVVNAYGYHLLEVPDVRRSRV